MMVVPVIAAVTAAVLILRAAGVFGHAQEHRAAAQLQISSSFVEAENRVRTEAGQRLVGKGQFSARIHSRADCRTVAHFIAHARGAGCGLLRRKSLTSLITWLTRAFWSCAASIEAKAKRRKASNEPERIAVATNESDGRRLQGICLRESFFFIFGNHIDWKPPYLGPRLT